MERLTETNNCIRFMETYLNVDCKECQYKGTGECEEFKDECKAVADFKEFVKNMYSKLKDYEDFEEQGKLLKLPCEIGHKVYGIYRFCGYGAWEIEERKIRLEDLENIDKTVFITRQAAEDKLAEMEGKK